MHHYTGTDVIDLTPEYAEAFSRLPTFRGDRKRDTSAGRARIDWLKMLALENKFHAPKWATAEFDGVVYRINGGHSSLMLSELNGRFPVGLKAIVDRFKCETRDDIADLFDQFDNRRSIRSELEKITSHKAIHDELDSASPSDVARAIRGIAFFMARDGEEKRLEAEERVRLIHQHRAFILWASKYIGTRIFGYVGVTAAMFHTYSKNPTLADQFWGLVYRQDHPNAKNATRVLASFLTASIAEKKPGTQRPRWNGRAYYVKAIHAANAWHKEADTDLKYHEKTSWPSLRW